MNNSKLTLFMQLLMQLYIKSVRFYRLTLHGNIINIHVHVMSVLFTLPQINVTE